MKVRYLFSWLFAILLLMACRKDKGNYNYISISDIKFEGIATNYTVTPGVEPLTINPKIISDHPENEFNYAWILYTGNQPDTIATTKDLNYISDKPQGSYILIYWIESKATGQRAHFKSVLNLGVSGHYILKQTIDGNTDIDLLLPTGKFGEDMLLNLNGKRMEGAPRSMSILHGKDFVDPDLLIRVRAHSLGIITHNKRLGIFRASDLRKIFDESSLFFEPKTNDIPYKFYRGNLSQGLISASGTYAENVGILQPSTISSGRYTSPSGVPGAGDHWAYWTLSGTNATDGIVYWDDAGKRLKWNNYNGIAFLIANSTLGDVASPNLQCLFMGSYRDRAYGIFKNVITNKTMLYTIALSRQTPVLSKVVQIADNSPLASGVHFATNAFSINIMYFVDNKNKTYWYDIANNVVNEMKFDGLPDNETITYISNRFNKVGSVANGDEIFDYITVATSNADKYTVRMYKMLGGIPDGLPVKTISGTGKVKEVHYLGITTGSNFTK